MELQLNPELLSQAQAIVLPILVALVTKNLASKSVKALTLAALSIVSGVVANAIADGGVIKVEPVLSSALTSYVTAVAAYYGYYKPSGVAGKVGEATKHFGFGKETEAAA